MAEIIAGKDIEDIINEPVSTSVSTEDESNSDSLKYWLYGKDSEQVATEEYQEEPIDPDEEVRASKDQEILDLTSLLTSSSSPIGDWKIAKIQEYVLAGLKAPYDIEELHSQRQAIRDRINALRKDIE